MLKTTFFSKIKKTAKLERQQHTIFGAKLQPTSQEATLAAKKIL